MSEEQKDLIIEAVQMAKDGFITRNEMVAKIKDIPRSISTRRPSADCGRNREGRKPTLPTATRDLRGTPPDGAQGQ
jgi:hypothetical protein